MSTSSTQENSAKIARSCGARPVASQSEFTYACDDCNVRMDAACVLASLPGEDLGGNQVGDVEMLRLFDHEHPFSLAYFKTKVSRGCHFGGKHILGPVYGCQKSRQYCHVDCCKLSRQISHPFHPKHPLNLVIEASKSVIDSNTQNRTCNFCGSFCESVLYDYHSWKFRLHIPCSAMDFCPGDSAKESGSWVEFFGHEHPMRPCLDNIDNRMINCRACEHRIIEEVYGCPLCKYFVHKSCAEMPQELNMDLKFSDDLTIAEIDKKIVGLKERLAKAEAKREEKGKLKAAKMKRSALCS
ncbi:hypothetical protein MLD38_038707 [Melastoma candidum]|uniref:Uncharacterized protein n=1 Tax=Melastoma candidum TaxID=119954 RepID=A0ACB9KZQ8_9MYRT|nr:hypothetical protein MLD38_038707 [Melastoma candidum]